MPYITSDISPNNQPDMRVMVDPLLNNIADIVLHNISDDESLKFTVVETAIQLFLEGLDDAFVLEEFFWDGEDTEHKYLQQAKEAVNMLSQTVKGTKVLRENVRGVCNYCITRMIVLMLFSEGVRYHRIDLTRGLLVSVKRGLAYSREMSSTIDCVWDEFYRRVAVPYEDKKRKENGDVYEGLV